MTAPLGHVFIVTLMEMSWGRFLSKRKKGGGVMRFFSYCPECGFDMYAEMAEAKKSAENHLAHFREDAAEDGWLDDVEATCWGEIKGAVEKGPEMTPCELFGCDGSCNGHHVFDVYCNYKLVGVE